MSVIHNIFFFIVAIGVLVTFHEFGHYWVARKMGVRVLRFSVGFGKPLFTWTRATEMGDIEYVIAAIPLGGYVKMLDEREADVREEDRKYAFNNKPLTSRAAIVVAGPAFNFILAIVFYWFVFVSGITVDRPLVGAPEVDSIADVAGFEVKDEILKVQDVEIKSWNGFRLAILDQGLDGGSLEILIKNKDGASHTRSMELGKTKLLDDKGDILKKLGFSQWWPDLLPEIGGVIEGGAAEKAGMQAGDIIRVVNNEPVEDWQTIVEMIKSNNEQAMLFVIERGSERKEISITPEVREIDGEKRKYVGIYQHFPEELKDELQLRLEYNVFEALPIAIEKTWDMSILTLRVLWKMVTGEASLANISGPVTIATYAGLTAKIGLNTFIGFLAVISISLGVLNLLPIPMLDGGHLFYYLIEAIKGSPVSEAFEMRGQQIGIALLAMLMFIALFNDFQRLMQ
jgi:regulator of sigma E protease